MIHRVLLVAPNAGNLYGRLARCGVHVSAARDADGALRALREHAVDLIVLQSGNASAAQDCREIRLLTDAPLLAVLDSHDEALVVSALEAGADSVLVAPVSRRELAARVEALCRLQRVTQPESTQPYVSPDGRLVIDPQAHTVRENGRELSLTPTEFRLLLALARRAGDVATHRELLSEVWGAGPVSAEHLRLYIRYLRRKLGDSAGAPRLVVNQRGVGYRFALAR